MTKPTLKINAEVRSLPLFFTLEKSNGCKAKLTNGVNKIKPAQNEIYIEDKSYAANICFINCAMAKITTEAVNIKKMLSIFWGCIVQP